MALENEPNDSKWTIIKNLILISIALTFLWTATKSMDNLQSSVHFSQSLGIATLSLIFACNTASCLFFSAWFIKKFGSKLSLILSMVTYVAYIAANFYGSWYTLIPVAIFQGIGNSVLYASIWTYIGNLALRYIDITKSKPEDINAIFYGVFHMFTQSSVIWGGIISFKVLNVDSNSNVVGANITVHNELMPVTQCGAQFCDYNVSKEDDKFSELPPNFYLLCLIFLAVGVAAMIITCFMDKQEPSQEQGKSVCEGLVETIKKIPDKKMLLLIPITFYAGLGWAYVGGDFTKAYMTCSWGVAYVGYVLICFGVTSTIASLLLGWTVRLLGRSAVFSFAAILDLFVYASLAYWAKTVTSLPLQFLMSGFFGVTTGVWQGQVKALFGSLFPSCPEVAFSLLGVFEASGISAGYGYSSALCTQTKLYILVAFLLAGMLCYVIIEVRVRKAARKEMMGNTKL